MECDDEMARLVFCHVSRSLSRGLQQDAYLEQKGHRADRNLLCRPYGVGTAEEMDRGWVNCQHHCHERSVLRWPCASSVYCTTDSPTDRSQARSLRRPGYTEQHFGHCGVHKSML